jgi:hypothetical protein
MHFALGVHNLKRSQVEVFFDWREASRTARRGPLKSGI